MVGIPYSKRQVIMVVRLVRLKGRLYLTKRLDNPYLYDLTTQSTTELPIPPHSSANMQKVALSYDASIVMLQTLLSLAPDDSGDRSDIYQLNTANGTLVRLPEHPSHNKTLGGVTSNGSEAIYTGVGGYDSKGRRYGAKIYNFAKGSTEIACFGDNYQSNISSNGDWIACDTGARSDNTGAYIKNRQTGHETQSSLTNSAINSVTPRLGGISNNGTLVWGIQTSTPGASYDSNNSADVFYHNFAN